MSDTVGFEDIEWVVNMGRMERRPQSMDTLEDWNESLALFLGYEGTVIGAENIRVVWTTMTGTPATEPRVTEVAVVNSTGTRFFEVEASEQTDAVLESPLSWGVGAGKKWLALAAPDVFVATHEFLRFLACFDAQQALGLVAVRNGARVDSGFVLLTRSAVEKLSSAAHADTGTTGATGSQLVRWAQRAGVALKDVGPVVTDASPDEWLGAHASDQIASGLRGPVVYTHVPPERQRDYFPYYVNFERGRHPRTFVYPPSRPVIPE